MDIISGRMIVHLVRHLSLSGCFLMPFSVWIQLSAWCLAVDRNSTKTRFNIDYPAVKPYYMRKELLSIGESSGEIDGIRVKTYDRERTICDCLRQVNKMDAEVSIRLFRLI